MNTWTASGIFSRTWRAPWTSISSTTGTPSAIRALELRAQRAVAVAGVLGVLDEVAGRDAVVELLGREEVVVDAVLLARPRRARRRRDRQLERRDAVEQRPDQRPLADSGRARDHEHLGHADARRSPLSR